MLFLALADQVQSFADLSVVGDLGDRVGTEPHKMLLGEVEVRLRIGFPQHRQDARLGGAGGTERPARAPGVLVLDGGHDPLVDLTELGGELRLLLAAVLEEYELSASRGHHDRDDGYC